MRATILAGLFSFLFAGIASGEVRTWTDKESGKKISAELVAVEGEKVVVKLKGGKEYTLPLSRFVDEDKAYAEKWLEEMKAKGVVPVSPAVRRAIRLTASEVTTNAEVSRSEDKMTKTTSSSTKYTLNLTTSRDAPELKDVKLDYTVYKRSRYMDTKEKSKGTNKIVEVTGTFDIDEALPGGAIRLYTTSSVTAIDKTQKYKEKKKEYEKRTRESVMGVVVKVTVGGQLVQTFAHPSNLERIVGEKE